MRAAALAECTVRHISLDDPSALCDTVTVSADATLSVSAMNLAFQLLALELSVTHTPCLSAVKLPPAGPQTESPDFQKCKPVSHRYLFTTVGWF